MDRPRVVETVTLTKTFGYKRVLRGITFHVFQGEAFGLLGPNGAGKTTLLSILSTLVSPTSGDALICGHSVREDKRSIKRNVGYLSHEPFLYRDLTGEENLKFYVDFYAADSGERSEERISAVLELLKLNRWRHEPVKNLSSGFRKRFDIARALVHNPSVLLMDEPFSALDVESQAILQRYISESKEAKTFLISTHDVDLAKLLCDRVAIISNGKLIEILDGAQITKASVLDAYGRGAAS